MKNRFPLKVVHLNRKSKVNNNRSLWSSQREAKTHQLLLKKRQ
jgi:hypothetical protein